MTLTRERLFHLFDIDLEHGQLRWKRPHGRANGRDQAGYPMTDHHGHVYWCVTIKRKIYRRARLIFLAAHGRFPHPTVDHIDTNKLNDGIGNLREATYVQNQQHRFSHKKTNPWPRGVSRNKKDIRFKAKIVIHGKPLHLGYFDTPEQAGEAYQEKRRELFGEFA